MTYRLPEWGVWSDDRKVMLATGFTDLEDAKTDVWRHFDAGDESVVVCPSCPDHPEHPLLSMRRKGYVYCRRTVDDIEHEVQY